MDLFKYNSLINAKFLIFYRGMMRDFYIYLKNITYFLSQYSLQQNGFQSPFLLSLFYSLHYKKKYPHKNIIQ